MLTLIAGGLICLSAATPASACPMCKLANESDNRLPRAYMYSILFMIGMPMTVLSGFSIGFWRLSRKAAQLQREAMEHAVTGASDPAVQAPEPRACLTGTKRSAPRPFGSRLRLPVNWLAP